MNEKLRVLLDSSGKTVIIPLENSKIGMFISFLKNSYLREYGLSNNEVSNILKGGRNIVFSRDKRLK